MKPNKLTPSEINHLRRLLGYVRCEIGQTPEENIAHAIADISDEGKTRLVDQHKKCAAVPQYVRAAIKALEKTIAKQDGEIVDAASREVKELK
jgi:hypothetical protein